MTLEYSKEVSLDDAGHKAVKKQVGSRLAVCA